MESLDQKLPDITLSTISVHETQTSNSVREYSDPIPLDLLIDIFSRVPAKSIARFRCVSKFWASILGGSYFSELFLTRSSTCPRLLFAFHLHNDKIWFYSSPQSQNIDDENSLVATKYPTYVSPKPFPSTESYLVHGLVCIVYWEDTWPVIFNPFTGESIPLPKVEAKNIRTISYFGYDPIDKQFKVLCMTNASAEHRVLTLETGKKMVWRMIRCKPHQIYYVRICINGVLYYRAEFGGSSVIVCFDVRSEKFSFIINEGPPYGTLINYKGKLGVYNEYWTKPEFSLLVLEDVEKHKWTKHTFILPPSLTKIDALYIVGMTSTGEIMVSSYYVSDPFYVFYFNPEKSTFRRVGIQGFEKLKNLKIHIFPDYVEDVKLIQSV